MQSQRAMVAQPRSTAGAEFCPTTRRTGGAPASALASNYHTWSVALWDKDGVHVESDAALRAIACLGGFWRLARLFLVLPRVIRNGVYRFIARNRIRWFGRIDSCALLSEKDRARLLP